jgi:hypothetical protein
MHQRQPQHQRLRHAVQQRTEQDARTRAAGLRAIHIQAIGAAQVIDPAVGKVEGQRAGGNAQPDQDEGALFFGHGAQHKLIGRRADDGASAKGHDQSCPAWADQVAIGQRHADENRAGRQRTPEDRCKHRLLTTFQ